jgi:hypothetical protein
MKGLQWNEGQRRIAAAILRHRREDDTYDSNAVHEEVPDVGLSTITKVYQALKKVNFIIPPEAPEGTETEDDSEDPTPIIEETSGDGVKKEEKKKPTKGISIVSFAQRKQGAILITVGDTNIDIGDPLRLIDTYQYYRSIQRMDPAIDDDFSTALHTAMKHVWGHISEQGVNQGNESNEGIQEDEK